MALPALITDTGVRVIDALSMETSGHLFADVAAIPRPSVVADTFIGTDAVAISAVGTNWCITIGTLPTIFAVAFKGIRARAMITSRQGNADVAVGTLPTNFAGTEVWGPALTMNTSAARVVANRLQTWVEGCFFVLELGFFPSRLADDIALAVAHVPGGVLQVLWLAGMVVDVQGCEPQPTA